MRRLKDLSEGERKRLLERSRAEVSRVYPQVEEIVERVKREGDRALRLYTGRFDGVEMEDFRVREEEFARALEMVDPKVLGALKRAHENIMRFHRRQKRAGWSYRVKGVRLGQVVRPIERVGCYVPGGRAAYPSTVLMTVTPARVAGVKRIVCTTPPTKEGGANAYTLAACQVAGVREVYKVGGAQAIAALAHGTETVPKVDKIVGPGNVYVTAAKRAVSGTVAIDNPAGPSEVLILADGTADPEYIALDMLAQAEHDPQASSVLVTTSAPLAGQVLERITKMSTTHRFRKEVMESLEKRGAVLIVSRLREGIEFLNEYAPEHLQIMTRSPRQVLAKVENAGSVFLGRYTPVACGDYASGTNHVLPTGGAARAYSGLGVQDFLKSISFQEADLEGLEALAEIIIPLAEVEGLYAHAESVRRRLERR